MYQDEILKDDSLQHKGICTVATKFNSNLRVSRVLALQSQKRAPKLMDWLVLKNGCTDLIDP